MTTAGRRGAGVTPEARSTFRRAFGAEAIGAIGALLTGCAAGGEVQRMAGDRVVSGHFVEPAAYARFLEAAELESPRDGVAAPPPLVALRERLQRYERVLPLDADDPEIWTRIGDLRCLLAPGDRAADAALDRALALDAAYAPALSARLRCAERRQDPVAVREAAKPLAKAALTDVDDQAQLAALEPDDAARARLMSVALDARTRSAGGWAHLGSFARAHDDAALAVVAWSEAVQGSLALAPRASSYAEFLTSSGDLPPARALAGAVMRAACEAPRAPFRPSPLIARLGIDEALLGGDLAHARSYALCGHVALSALAARALLLGDTPAARALARQELDADPASRPAAWVLLASAEVNRSSSEVPRAALPDGPGGALPAEVFAAVTLALTRIDPVAARAFAERVVHESPIPLDLLVLRAIDEGAKAARERPSR